MSVPYYAGVNYSEAWGGASSPDPVTTGDPSFTWDIEFSPVAQSLYARGLLSYLDFLDSSVAAVGIVQYSTRNTDGSDTIQAVGESASDGIVPFIWDSNVNSVTFGWFYGGGTFEYCRFNMEIWV